MKAQHILESIQKFSIDDAGNPIHCLECKSEKINLFSTINDFKSLLAFLFGFISGTLPFYSKDKYRCENCNTEFDLK